MTGTRPGARLAAGLAALHRAAEAPPLPTLGPPREAWRSFIDRLLPHVRAVERGVVTCAPEAARVMAEAPPIMVCDVGRLDPGGGGGVLVVVHGRELVEHCRRIVAAIDAGHGGALGDLNIADATFSEIVSHRRAEVEAQGQGKPVPRPLSPRLRYFAELAEIARHLPFEGEP